MKSCRRQVAGSGVWGVITGLVGILALAAPPVRAAGLMVPAGGGSPLSVEKHSVHVDINNVIAVTEVEQVFRNDSDSALEAVYSFVLPRGASLAGFSMWIGGKEVTGEVLERSRARKIYQETVHPVLSPESPPLFPLKDPGLVEEVSYREYQVTIFPVPARGTQRVKVTYYQYLTLEGDQFTYTYPLETRATEDSRVHGRFSLDVGLRSSVPVLGCGFPSRFEEEIVSEVFSRHRANVHLFRADGDLDRDFSMTCRLSREGAGLDLIAYRKPGEDGYFLLLAGLPLSARPETVEPVDYTFIVDVSGSMRKHRRIDQAAAALVRFLESSGPNDRFNVIAFNVSPTALSSSPLPNDSVSRERLREFLRDFPAVGGTDLYPALELAYRQADSRRRQALVVISDGGVNDLEEAPTRILEMARAHDVTLFGLGIGNDANLPLLEALARATGGFTAQISSQEDLVRRGAMLRERMLREPMRHLQLEADAAAGIYDVAPANPGDLYPGGQVALVGRFRGEGPSTFRLRGTVDGSPMVLETEADLSQTDTLNPEIRRMWAERRVADLLQGIREGRASREAQKAITELGIDYSIVTRFTSFLVLENDEMFREHGIRRRTASLLDEESSARLERARRADQAAVASGDRPGPVRWIDPTEGGLGALGPESIGALGALWALREFLRRRGRA